MPVTLDGLRLWGARDSSNETDAKTNVTSPPSEPSSDTIISSLEAGERQPISGRVTGIQLTGESGYSSDPEVAVAEWLQESESLCSPEQGGGWDLVDDERNRTITGVVTEVSHTVSYGSPFEASWDLTFIRGDGVLTDEPRSPTTSSPSSTSTLDGNDLGTVDEKRTSRSMEVQPNPIAFESPGETVITPESGVVQEFTLSGRKAGTQSELRSFDDNMRGLLGGNQPATYQTGMPGTSHSVVVDTYDSTYTAGSPSVLSYSLTLIEGLALRPGP